MEYQQCWQAMKDFTECRNNDTCDEFWLVQHPKVFTLGQAGKSIHILNAHNIPIINSDRGGQVTYHGPGQLIIYTLIDIKRLGLGTRALVTALEHSIILSLAHFNIKAFAKKAAPGVYIKKKMNAKQDEKIASLGLRIRRGKSYHGLSINLTMDLTPFSYINPCGYSGQQVTQVSQINPDISEKQFENVLISKLCEQLQFTPVEA